MTIKKLKETREEHDLSLAIMSDILGISKAYYWQLENGKRRLYYEMALHIANIFKLKPDDLFFEHFNKE